MSDDASDRPSKSRGRLATWTRRRIGWWRLGARRTWTRLRQTAPRRTLAAIGGVAIAVSLLLVVSALSLGMVGPATGIGGEEYWVSPEDDASSPLVATDGPQFGSVTEGADRLRSVDGVDAVTPVRTDVVRTDRGEFVVAVGLDPSAGIDLYGIDPSPLASAPDGVVVSDGAASRLDVRAGETVSIGERDRTVADVGGADGLASASPLVVFELSQLQDLLDADDTADQFVVRGSGVDTDELEAVYPESEVSSSDELAMGRLGEADLPLALSVAALVVSILVGTIFVSVTTAMDVLADRRELGTLAAIGVPRRRRRGLFVVQALALATVGGLVGTAIGVATIRGGNALTRTVTGFEAPLAFHPLFLGYGLVVAWVIACCSLPSVAIAIRQLETGGDLRG
ncbi:ABC transporter permease [Halovivax gelatinilyticus]|uniref:ABC transporter permease n=1 Tax=Halovivax gelatinilyticus TaxID=2961597 RepID=UPI0020CA83CC|nr:ABC transporter permease [Halovivax gelatinilyticus]